MRCATLPTRRRLRPGARPCDEREEDRHRASGLGDAVPRRPDAEAESVAAVVLGTLELPGVERPRGVLDQPLHAEPRSDRGRHDLSDAVRVLDGRPLDVGVAVRVGAGARVDVRSIEGVREVNDERVERLHHRHDWVHLDEHEGATGPERARDAGHPRVEVVDPAQHADRGVDVVELPSERRGEPGRVRLQRGHGDPALLGEHLESVEGRPREVDRGDRRTLPRHRDRVAPDVALQVQHGRASEAAPARREVDRGALLLAHERPAGAQQVEVVVAVVARAVEPGERLPVLEVRVGRGVVVHRRGEASGAVRRQSAQPAAVSGVRTSSSTATYPSRRYTPLLVAFAASANSIAAEPPSRSVWVSRPVSTAA